MEKFMERMGIDIQIASMREFISSRGRKNICVGLIAYYKNKPTYSVYNCYDITNTGLISWEEGNFEIPASDGIFKYLGANRFVDKYFETMTRNFLERDLAKN
jgi:hypothetical protein